MNRRGRRPTSPQDLSFLGCLGVFAGIIGLIVFIAVSASFLIGLRGSSSSAPVLNKDVLPLWISGPITAAAVVGVLWWVQRYGRANEEELGDSTGPRKGHYASRLPLWVRGLGLVPILFLLPMLMTGGPPRSSSRFQHSYTIPEVVVAALGVVVSVPPIMALFAGRGIVLAGTIAGWLGWSATTLAGQYGWGAAIAAGDLVFAGVAIWLIQRARRKATPPDAAPRAPRPYTPKRRSGKGRRSKGHSGKGHSGEGRDAERRTTPPPSG
ncbi:hypothetical protein F0L68_05885 [Solihabitans fulvus]|uniref:Uncharacterized protein n=1 Tax=Solihabitans fulvus TaxID=1892852 RepID=A0A5B2XL90_9PSEU|nr:hypothetical protein [Solihabitans fulvus]KAA2264628.1 hypothetical protein F0L68_05885 [Solihabitans fulvus]